MKPKTVQPCDIQLDPVSGLVRVDKIPIFKLVRYGDILLCQFLDPNMHRVEGRGTNVVELAVGEFITCVQDLVNQFEG